MIITEDIAKTILAGCYKFGAATMLRCGGATMTKVIEVYEEESRQTDRGDNLQGEILPILGGVNIGRSQRFFRDGLCNISATLLAKNNDASIVEVYEEDTQTKRSDWNKREEAHRNR